MSRHAIILAALSVGCGAATQDEPTALRSDAGAERRRPADDDGMAIEGLTGSLRRDEVDPVMNRAAQRFTRCYADALDEHPFLAGDLALQVVVAPDGSVSSARTTSATLGSRAVEECILGVARGLRFPRPHGGPATFDYGPVLFNPGDGAPPPELWDRGRVAEVLAAEENAAALRACGCRGLSATLYVGPGGRARSVGAVAPTSAHDDAARCLERVLSGLTYPDPGSRVAKLTVEL